ncbi:unnamed protein product [Amoebophrya sp. A25]|nr:unnamed protein product [Amoebophrya sp. A25]|eukprot:GSA25T00016012001.1
MARFHISSWIGTTTVGATALGGCLAALLYAVYLENGSAGGDHEGQGFPLLGSRVAGSRLARSLCDAPFAACVFLSVLGYFLVVRIVPSFAPKFVDAGLCGVDLSKKTTARNADGSLKRPVEGVKVPEALGVIAGTVYLFCVTAFLPFAFSAGPRTAGIARTVPFTTEGSNAAERVDVPTGMLGPGSTAGAAFVLQYAGAAFSKLAASVPIGVVQKGLEGSIEAEIEATLLNDTREPGHGSMTSDVKMKQPSSDEAVNLAADHAISSTADYAVDSKMKSRKSDVGEKGQQEGASRIEQLSAQNSSGGRNIADGSGDDETLAAIHDSGSAKAALQAQVDTLSRMVQFLAAILSISSMSFFGFCDNVLNLRWRDKFLLPTLASLPLLLVYFATLGTTSVLLPLPLRWLVSFDIVNLGPFFYIFLCLITVFCVNAINIYAGVNGLEAGQSLIIAVSLVCNNVIQLLRLPDDFILGRERHVFSIYILLPFIATTLGLLKFNWYPSRVFVGDTYCYFAGMTLAVAGIFGHYSKTLLLFLMPQILNFIYGLPQLLRLVECPRHRLPAYDSKNDVSMNSFATVCPEELSGLGRLFFGLYRTLRLCKVEEIRGAEAGAKKAYRMSNLTLINFVLYVLGPMHEETLVIVLLLLQTAFSAFAFWLRYFVSTLLYSKVL